MSVPSPALVKAASKSLICANFPAPLTPSSTTIIPLADPDILAAEH